jgi:protein associated with RNAse G/E
MLTLSKEKWSLADARRSVAFSWSVVRLGSDRHGTWLGSRRGNLVRQPDGRQEIQQHDAVWVIDEHSWWLTAFWFTPETDLTVDICTPPTREGETWSFVDLELDLFRRSDGQAAIVDQEEFDLLAASGLVAESELQTAADTARDLLPLIQTRSEPFGDAALPWLRALRA